MTEPTKLIEAMKKLKVIEKRIDANSLRIQEYASLASNERPYFSTEKEQGNQVASLIQANKDLVAEYLNLKKRVDMTNLKTQVTIGKDSFAIADLLILRRGLSKKMQVTFHALNDKQALQKIQVQQRVTPIGEKAPFVIRCYEENQKHEWLQYWQGLDDEIEQRLEVINATTPLVEL